MKTSNEILQSVMIQTGTTPFQVVRVAELIDKKGLKAIYSMSKKQVKIAKALVKTLEENQ